MTNLKDKVEFINEIRRERFSDTARRIKEMKYKAKFKFKNGIEGEVNLTAENDGEAFIAGCKMFALFDFVEWTIEKVDALMNCIQ